MESGSSFASDVQAVFKRELEWAYMLLRVIVRDFSDTGFQDVAQMAPLVTQISHGLFQKAYGHKAGVVPKPVGHGLDAVQDRLGLPEAIIEPFLIGHSGLATYGFVFKKISNHGYHLLALRTAHIQGLYKLTPGVCPASHYHGVGVLLGVKKLIGIISVSTLVLGFHWECLSPIFFH